MWLGYQGSVYKARFFIRGIHGLIQNFPDWCRHLHSSCGSAKHRWMVGQPCLASQRARFHVGRMMWAVFTRVYLESCTWPVVIFTIDQRKEQRVCIKFCANLWKMLRRPSQWFNKPSGTKAWVVGGCFNGMPGSRPVAHQLTTNTQGDPQVA